MIRAVLFDFDGVLVDSMPAHVKAWTQILAEVDITVAPLYIELHEGEKAEDTVIRLLNEHDQDSSAMRVRDLIERKRTLYQERAPRGLNAVARQLVDTLREKKIRCHIVTGSIRRNLDRTISPEELSLFDSITSADDYERGKPNPDPYLIGLARSESQAHEVLVLENAPLGIRAAVAAGLKTVAITSTLSSHYLSEAHHIISTHLELLNYV